MPAYDENQLYKDKFGLWGRLPDPQSLQDLFDANDVPINLKTHEGVENIVRLGGGGNITFPTQKDNDFFFGDYNMMEMNGDNFTRSGSYTRMFKDALNKEKGYEDIRLFVPRKGNDMPLELTYDKASGKYRLAEPVVEVGPPPRKPNLWQRIAHALFGAYDKEYKAYNDAVRNYNKRVTEMDARKQFLRRSSHIREDEAKEREKMEAQAKAAEEREAAREKQQQAISEHLDKQKENIEAQKAREDAKRESRTRDQAAEDREAFRQSMQEGIGKQLDEQRKKQQEAYEASLDDKAKKELAEKRRVGRTREQAEKDREAFRERQQAGVASHIDGEAFYKQCLGEVQTFLDQTYSGIEKESGDGRINRLDNVEINGKTLRTYLMEDCFAKSGQTRRATVLSANDVWKKMPENERQERSCQIILDAMLSGKAIHYVRPDPKTGVPQLDEQGRPIHVLPQLTSLTEAKPNLVDAAYQRATARTDFVNFEKFQSDAERLHTVDKCCEAMLHNDYMARLEMASSQSGRIKDQFFSHQADFVGKGTKEFLQSLPNPAKFILTKDRGGLCSHALCKLLVDGMSWEDAIDPNKFQAQKQVVGQEVVKQYRAGNMDWFGKVNMEGNRILRGIINKGMAGVDVMDNKSLFAPGNEAMLAAAQTMFDLQQESDKIKPACNKVAAEWLQKDLGREVTEQEVADYRANEYRLNQNTAKLIANVVNGETRAARMAVGDDISHVDRAVSAFFVSELSRSAIKNAKDKGLPIEESFDDAEKISGFDDIKTQFSRKEVAKEPAPEMFNRLSNPTSISEACKFGSLLMNGNVRNNFQMNYQITMQDGLPVMDLKMNPKPDISKAPQPKTVVKEDLKKVQGNPQAGPKTV